MTSTCMKWAAPEFLEMAARELLEEQWKKKTSAKLPGTTKLFEETGTARVVGKEVPGWAFTAGDPPQVSGSD